MCTRYDTVTIVVSRSKIFSYAGEQMRELGGTVEYLYWSSRRTERFLNDNNISVPQLTTTIASPGRGWLPTFSRTVVDLGNRRPQIAKTIDAALGQMAVSRFDGPGPIKYAKGISPVVFGEFVTWGVEHERQPAVMFTVVDHGRRDKRSVAVCLFGSMDNFPERVQTAGPAYDGGPFKEGWVSSSAPAVYDFIRSHGKQFDDLYYTPALMAEEALKIADGQGIFKNSASGDFLGIDRAWERSFTYGELAKAQWLAEIYLDVDLSSDESFLWQYGFRRVLVGAPLWIKTPEPQAIKLYAQTDLTKLVDPKPHAKRPRRLNANKHNELLSASDIILSPTANEVGLTVPFDVYGSLKAGFITGIATTIVDHMDDEDPRITILNPALARIFVWEWQRDRDLAMIMLADLLASIRGRQEMSDGGESPVLLDEVLRAIALYLPSDFSEYREVVMMARKEVRQYFGSDPNSK
jgi:hypothetical protein